MTVLTANMLVEMGQSLYGDEWEVTLARRLKVSRRTVMRWRDEECAMPAGLFTVLEALVEQQIAALECLRVSKP